LQIGLIQLSIDMLIRGFIRWIGQRPQVFVLLMASVGEYFAR